MSRITPSHVLIDDQGTAWIDETNVKVVEVVLARLAHGWSPEEIHFQHPNLTLAQIHAALAYYYNHQLEMDQQIERQVKEADTLAAKGADSPVRRRLRRASRLP